MPQIPRLPLPPVADRVLAAALDKWAADQPEAMALEFPAHEVGWTYREFAQAAQRLAGGFRGLGLHPRDRIAIMLPNCPEYALAWYGSLSAGLIDVAINHHLVKDLLKHQLSVARVAAVVTTAAGAAAVSEVLPELEQSPMLILVGSGSADSTQSVVPFDALRDATPLLEPLGPTEAVSIRYTSGTTGPAKAVAMTNSQMSVLGLQPAALIGHGPGGRLYTCFPLHHGLSSILGIGGSLSSGGCCIVDEKFSASGYWAQIRAAKATRAHILGPMVAMVMAQPESESDRDHDCTTVWTAPRNSAFESRFGVKLVTHYSMTEGNVIAFVPPGAENREGSSGQVSPHFDVRIADSNDEEVPAGQPGQILWRPRTAHLMMAGYWGNPAATVQAWQGLWFHSGDEGRFDADGYLYLIGRMGDQIRRKGVNIPAQSIEDAARKAPGVIDAAAIAVPSELGDSEVKLTVAVRPDFETTAAAFADFLSQHLPPEMVPRFLEFRDSLPQTDTYKVSKAQLRQEWLAGGASAATDLRGR